MKTSKSYRIMEERRTSFIPDQTVWLAGLTLVIFGYIVFYFLYPMISKGLLF
ncbi:MAG: hypothetical protein U0X91_30080 [Spirosomataceae bacterium]